MKLAEFLINYRIEHKLSRFTMAKQCKISESTLVYLEKQNNTKQPNASTIMKILGNLQVSEEVFEDLVTHDELFWNMDTDWIWEKWNENMLLQYYRQMNRRGKKIALMKIKELFESREFD